MKLVIVISTLSMTIFGLFAGFFGFYSNQKVLAQAQDTFVPVTISTIADIPFANGGGVVNYTTTVTNGSGQVLTGLMIRHNWPAVLLDQGVVAGVTSWNIETLPPQSSKTKTFSFIVREDVVPTVYQGSTSLVITNPSWQQQALYTLDVRQVQVLADALPDTSVPDKLYLLGFFIIAQMSLIATWALRGVILSSGMRRNK